MISVNILDCGEIVFKISLIDPFENVSFNILNIFQTISSFRRIFLNAKKDSYF